MAEYTANIVKFIMEIFPMIGIVSTATVASIATSLLRAKFKKSDPKPSLEVKIKKLSSSLYDSASLINEVEKEIAQKEGIVVKLQKDADTYSELSKLKKSEVEAITSVLQTTLDKQGDKSFWSGVIVNALFFIAGAIVSVLVSFLK